MSEPDHLIWIQDWFDMHGLSEFSGRRLLKHYGIKIQKVPVSRPDGWLRTRKEDKKRFFCPNGHGQAFTESQTDVLRRERDRLKQQLAFKDDEIARQRKERHEVERRVSAAKGQITRLKKRAKAGVCPCCNRTFGNMAEHMRRQHPTYDPSVVDLEAERDKRSA